MQGKALRREGNRVSGLAVPWLGWRFGWVQLSFGLVVLLALGLRLWELEGRAVHYDEAIHVSYAWRYSVGDPYIHSPWMHGPFQILFTSGIFRIFGDTEFTARLGYVLLGTGLVSLPYFLRGYVGSVGAVLIALMLAVSPTMLYFSRFGREDMPMAFWTAALFVLMWRYIHEGKHRYLYLGSAVLAFMFATKETAYFVTLIFGLLMFLLAVPDLVPWVFRRNKLSDFAGPAGFFMLMLTLTLPQWSPALSLFQGFFGLTLANPDGVTNGIVGAPHWAAPFVGLPLYDAPWWFHGMVVVGVVGVLVGIDRWLKARPKGLTPFAPFSLEGRRGISEAAGAQADNLLPPTIDTVPRGRIVQSVLVPRVVMPLEMMAATSLVLFRPVQDVILSGGTPVVDFSLAAVLAVFSVAIIFTRRLPWKESLLLLVAPVLLTSLYGVFFTPVLDVDALVNGVLPPGIGVIVSDNAIPVNYLVAAGIILFTFALSVYLGVSWRGGVWLVCALIFYGIWLTLYTTLYSNWAGFFSGIWQGMGYWIAQQEVARGGQPWYYYFVSLSVYELLPAIFGLVGAVYFLKKGDVLGLALAFWAGLTLLAYTIASEKMPWLLVHLTMPLIFVAGKFLGQMAELVPWRSILRRGRIALLFLPPLVVGGGVYLLYHYVQPQGKFSTSGWAILLEIAALALLSAYLVRLARPKVGLALVGLGLAALLLGFGVVAALRAAYTYDDSNVEILVYAQGSADLPQAFQALERGVFQENLEGQAVEVDYDIWYPFTWYVRHQEKQGQLGFYCFKAAEEKGYNSSCLQAPRSAGSRMVLLGSAHSSGNSEAWAQFQREGPKRNLLWFPETYRRPGEDRQREKLKEELTKDLKYFKNVVGRRESWNAALDYLLFRELKHDWYFSDYYTLVREDQP